METPRKFVSTKLNKYIVFTMQTYKELESVNCKYTKDIYVLSLPEAIKKNIDVPFVGKLVVYTCKSLHTHFTTYTGGVSSGYFR